MQDQKPKRLSADGQYWAKHARRYDRAARLLNRNFDAMAQAVAALLAGQGRVLEIAAGTGMLSEKIANQVEHLTATDLAPAMLEILQARLQAQGQTNVDVQSADATRLPFADASFSAVVMANVLHLFPQPELALVEARRVLTKNGLLIAPTFCHGQNWRAQTLSQLLGLSGFPIASRFSADSLADLLKHNGFTVSERSNFAGLLPLTLLSGQPSA